MCWKKKIQTASFRDYKEGNDEIHAAIMICPDLSTMIRKSLLGMNLQATCENCNAIIIKQPRGFGVINRGAKVP